MYEFDFYDTTSVLKLAEITCSCIMWELTKITCKHAIATIYNNRKEPKAYVQQFFTKATYFEVCNHSIQPDPSQDAWKTTYYPDIHGLWRSPQVNLGEKGEKSRKTAKPLQGF